MSASTRLLRRLPVLFALLSAALCACPAAAEVSSNGDATAAARLLRPGNLRFLQDLNFAYLSVTTAGTAVVDPNTDAMTTTGGVMHIGGTPYAALFEAVAPVKAVVIIRIPRNPVTLTRLTGTETMTVSNWTVSGNARRTVAAQEPFNFKVGGTLNVGANQREGLYVGTFQVEIQYP